MLGIKELKRSRQLDDLEEVQINMLYFALVLQYSDLKRLKFLFDFSQVKDNFKNR